MIIYGEYLRFKEKKNNFSTSGGALYFQIIYFLFKEISSLNFILILIVKNLSENTFINNKNNIKHSVLPLLH